MNPRMPFRVVAPPARRYKGRRARRQAFYHRQRAVRLLQRLLRTAHTSGLVDEMSHHDADALMYGLSMMKVLRDGTLRQVRPWVGVDFGDCDQTVSQAATQPSKELDLP